MADKRMTEDEVIGELSSGMTLGIGGWGSRRKPISFVRAILRSGLDDLHIVSYGGPDVGILCAARKVRKVTFGFVSLDSIPLEPHFRLARQAGGLEVAEIDEGAFYLGLLAAAHRVPFYPTRAGLGSDMLRYNPEIRTVRRPYDDGEELVEIPVVDTDQFLVEGSVHTLRIPRLHVDGVVEAQGGAHFTECPPDYGRDESFQRDYAATAKDPMAWERFCADWLELESRDSYRRKLTERGRS